MRLGNLSSLNIYHMKMRAEESMVQFKERLGIRQFMKDKPVRFDVKMCMAAVNVT